MLCVQAVAQAPQANISPDSDHDGVSDAQEQALLLEFEPRFMISRDDCSSEPAEFTPSQINPQVAADDGTIYGQAFPRAGRDGAIELHYYDLWRRDCGEMGHNLDAEHVAVLLDRDKAGTWKARYWYAAAHEDTLCDASQMAAAATLHAEQRGPDVWISGGKHAAFLSQDICGRGCGGDECGHSKTLPVTRLINLGEPSAPMSGASWSASPAWPLAGKMQRSDFSRARTARLEGLAPGQIVWASPKKRPAQAAVLGGNQAIAGAAVSLHATDAALASADDASISAVNHASANTGSALSATFRTVMKALHASTGPAPASNGK